MATCGALPQVETAPPIFPIPETFTGVRPMAGKETEDRAAARAARQARNMARFNAMFQGRPSSEKFLALMMMNGAGPEVTEAALNAIQGGGGAAMETVIPELGGRRVRHFAGKSRAQLMREFDNDETKVGIALDAMRGAGLDVDDEQRARTTADETAERALNPARLPHSPTAAGAGSLPIGPAGGVEPTFGADQWPASELWGNSDADLLAVDGITAADVVRIRQLQQAEADRSRQVEAARMQGTGNVAAPIVGATPEGAAQAAQQAGAGEDVNVSNVAPEGAPGDSTGAPVAPAPVGGGGGDAGRAAAAKRGGGGRRGGGTSTAPGAGNESGTGNTSTGADGGAAGGDGGAGAGAGGGA